MKKKNMIIITLGFVGMLAGSSLLYHSLSKDYTEEKQANTELIQENLDQEEISSKDPEQTRDLENQDTSDSELAENLENFDTFDSENLDSIDSNLPSNDLETMEAEQEVATSDETNSLSENSTTDSKEEAPITNESTNSGNNNSSSSVTSSPTNAPVVNSPTPTNVPMVTATPVPTKAPTATPEPTKAPIKTNTAANFTVQDYSGNNVSLSSFFGKPIVVNFWASWCGPCKSEMPAFQSVYQDYKNDVVFLMVNMVDGYRETKENGYKYISSQGFTFPVYYDVKQSAAYAYGITSYPTTYFIDANGNVATYTKGSMSESSLRRQVQSLLN